MANPPRSEEKRRSSSVWDKIDLDALEADRSPPSRPSTDIYTPSTDRHNAVSEVKPPTGRIAGDFSFDDDDPPSSPDADPAGIQAPSSKARFRTDVIRNYTVNPEDEEADPRNETDGVFVSPAWDIDDETSEPDIDRPATNWFFTEKNAPDQERSTQEAPANLIKELRQAFEIGGAAGGWRHYLEIGGTFNPWILPQDLLIAFTRLHYGRKDWESLGPILDQMIGGYPADAAQARLLKALYLMEHHRDPAAAKALLEAIGRDGFTESAHQDQFDRLLARADRLLADGAS